MRLCTMLKSAPITPAMTEMATMKGSCSNHSLFSSSATPLKDNTPYFHLHKYPGSLAVPPADIACSIGDAEIGCTSLSLCCLLSHPMQAAYHRACKSLAWGAAEPG